MQLVLSNSTLGLLSDQKKLYSEPQSVLKLISELTESVSGFMNPKQKARFYSNAVIALNDKTVQSYPPLIVIGILIESATYDLSLSKSLQECYIIPYKNLLQFVVGYKGWIKMFNRSGCVGSISDGVVYKDDFFESKMVNGIEYISHDRKAFNLGTPLEAKNVTHTWVTIVTVNNFVYSASLTKAQIQQRMDVANKKENQNAYAFYEPMFIKGCYKVLAKRFPLADEDRGIRDECTFVSKIKENGVLEIVHEDVYINEDNNPTLSEKTEQEILGKLKSITTIQEFTDFGLEIKPTGNLRKVFSERYKEIIAENAVNISDEEIKAEIDSFVTIEELTSYVKSIGLKEGNELYAYAMQARKKVRALLVEKQIFLDEWLAGVNLTLEEVELIPEYFNENFNTHLALHADLLLLYTNFVLQFKSKQNV